MKKKIESIEDEEYVDFEETLMEEEQDYDGYDYDKILDQIEDYFNGEPNEDIGPCDSYTEKNGEKLPNLIEGDFSNASLYEKVIANQLLGVFYSSKNYEISEDIVNQLLAIPKKFDERVDNIAYADTDIQGHFLRFRVEFKLGEEYSTAKLFLIEKLGPEFDRNADTLVTLLGEFFEPTRINFYNRAYAYFNIDAEVDYMEIDKFVELKGKLALFADRQFNPWVLMMLMRGMKDPTLKEYYNALLASATMDLELLPEMSLGLSLLTNPGMFGLMGLCKSEQGFMDRLLGLAYDNEYGKGKGGCSFCRDHEHDGHHHHHDHNHEHHGKGPYDGKNVHFDDFVSASEKIDKEGLREGLNTGDITAVSKQDTSLITESFVEKKAGVELITNQDLDSSFTESGKGKEEDTPHVEENANQNTNNGSQGPVNQQTSGRSHQNDGRVL